MVRDTEISTAALSKRSSGQTKHAQREDSQTIKKNKTPHHKSFISPLQVQVFTPDRRQSKTLILSTNVNKNC